MGESPNAGLLKGKVIMGRGLPSPTSSQDSRSKLTWGRVSLLSREWQPPPLQGSMAPLMAWVPPGTGRPRGAREEPGRTSWGRLGGEEGRTPSWVSLPSPREPTFSSLRKRRSSQRGLGGGCPLSWRGSGVHLDSSTKGEPAGSQQFSKWLLGELPQKRSPQV